MRDTNVSNFEANTTPSTSRTPVFTAMATAEKPRKFTELWYALEKKYKTEDAGLKKFVDAKFLDYKMVDSKIVMSQVQELQVIIHDLLVEDMIKFNSFIVKIVECVIDFKLSNVGMIINGIFQVAALIKKLLHSWKHFKNYLKHKRKEMTFENMIIRLRIEEDNKAVEKKAKGNSIIWEKILLRMVQINQKRGRNLLDRRTIQVKKKFRGDCHNCGKIGHKAVECRVSKKEKKKGQANMVDTNRDVESLFSMLTECNLAGNLKKWWLDSGSTSPVCAVQEIFAIYSSAALDETIYMKNSTMTKVEGYGKVFLKMTSDKVVTLNKTK
ncbi:uncharacterized protein LOC129884372 [Solanum dulcamara]|uniref:uncharacterized protein LOC129884372 n=1 Tax=Solanum dulcamara TaxID=45834 RepID=UPI0024855C78|nr:uncharacterized protein LOC129884372 [Solanum dulcamara]